MSHLRVKDESPKEVVTGRIEEACRRYNIGKTTMRKLADDAKATLKIGRVVLINFKILDEYLIEMCHQQNSKQ